MHLKREDYPAFPLGYTPIKPENKVTLNKRRMQTKGKHDIHLPDAQFMQPAQLSLFTYAIHIPLSLSSRF